MKSQLVKKVTDIFDDQENIFSGAYGNKNSDARAYLKIGIPSNRIFLVDEDSVMKRLSDDRITSYAEHEQQVNLMYPRI